MSDADLPTERGESLPEELPADPFGLFQAWQREAFALSAQPNPHSMGLTSVDAAGRPSSRMVLCKHIQADPGYVVFYTNYESRKAVEMELSGYAAGLMHWDHVQRQVRLEGRVVRSPEAESDEYFQSRNLLSRLGAWASNQSRPIESHDALMLQVAQIVDRFDLSLEQLADPEAKRPDIEIPRPPHWGGYRLHVDRLELWQGLDGRLHDRARWSRTLSDELEASPWTVVRLQP